MLDAAQRADRGAGPRALGPDAFESFFIRSSLRLTDQFMAAASAEAAQSLPHERPRADLAEPPAGQLLCPRPLPSSHAPNRSPPRPNRAPLARARPGQHAPGRD